MLTFILQSQSTSRFFEFASVLIHAFSRDVLQAETTTRKDDNLHTTDEKDTQQNDKFLLRKTCN
jgi:hypothetical protein